MSRRSWTVPELAEDIVDHWYEHNEAGVTFVGNHQRLFSDRHELREELAEDGIMLVYNYTDRHFEAIANHGLRQEMGIPLH